VFFSSRFDRDHLPEDVKRLHVEVWFLGEILFLSPVIALLPRPLCFGGRFLSRRMAGRSGWGGCSK
jgi:hypothetical protein